MNKRFMLSYWLICFVMASISFVTVTGSTYVLCLIINRGIENHEERQTKVTYLTLINKQGDHINHVKAIGNVWTGLNKVTHYRDSGGEVQKFTSGFMSSSEEFKCEH